MAHDYDDYGHPIRRPAPRRRNPATHYLVVVQDRPPGGNWRPAADYGPYTDIAMAKAKARVEADWKADAQQGGWAYRVCVYPSDARGEVPSFDTRPAATVYPSKARNAAQETARKISEAKLYNDWDTVAKLERWGKGKGNPESPEESVGRMHLQGSITRMEKGDALRAMQGKTGVQKAAILRALRRACGW